MKFTTEDLRSGQMIRTLTYNGKYEHAVIREVGAYGLHLSFVKDGHHQYCAWEWLPGLQVNIEGLYLDVVQVSVLPPERALIYSVGDIVKIVSQPPIYRHFFYETEDGGPVLARIVEKCEYGEGMDRRSAYDVEQINQVCFRDRMGLTPIRQRVFQFNCELYESAK